MAVIRRGWASGSVNRRSSVLIRGRYRRRCIIVSLFFMDEFMIVGTSAICASGLINR